MTTIYEISALAEQLYSALAPYIRGTPSDRDRLLEEHGHSLTRLNRLLHPLTRSRLEREHLVVAQQIFLEIAEPLEGTTQSIVNASASCVSI